MFWQAVFAARGLEHASMDSNQPRPSIGFYVLFGLPHFDAASDEVVGYGIAVVVDRDVALHVHQAMVE